MKDLQHGTGNRSVDLATSPRLKCKQLSMVQFLLEVGSYNSSQKYYFTFYDNFSRIKKFFRNRIKIHQILRQILVTAFSDTKKQTIKEKNSVFTFQKGKKGSSQSEKNEKKDEARSLEGMDMDRTKNGEGRNSGQAGP